MKNTKFVVKVIRGSGTQYVERVDLIPIRTTPNRKTGPGYGKIHC